MLNLNNVSDDTNVLDFLYSIGVDRKVDNNLKKYFDYYTVSKGDSLYAIGKKYNINPELLASLNGLNYNDYIYPNQTIMIPKEGYSYYITKEGDTLDTVADVFETTKNKVFQDNNVIYLQEGQLLVRGD